MATVDGFDIPIPSSGSGLTIKTVGGVFETQVRVIWAIFVRELKRKYIRHPLDFLFDVGQPIAFMALVRYGMQFLRGSDASNVIGGYEMMFLATGMLPVFCFRRCVSGGRQCYSMQRKLLFLPMVNPIDLFFVGSLIEIVVHLFMMLGITIAFMLIYKMPEPQDLALGLLPFVINGLIGFGFAMFNTCVELKYPFYSKIFQLLTAPLNVISGMFWVAASFPKMAWAFLYWNPFLHSTEWVRSALFWDYTSQFVDPYYYLFFALVVLAMGFGAERLFRRSLVQLAL